MRTIVLVALAVSVAFAAPLIMINKEASESHVLLGSKVTFTTTAVNVGDEAVSDFILEDGGEKQSVAALAPGENVTITTTVDAAALGELAVPVATATWGDANARQRATSNKVREEERNEKRHATELGPRGLVEVLTSAAYERRNARYIKESIVYLIFAAIVVLFPYGVYRQSQLQVDFLLKESRKKA